jgi:hypothetical protein
MATEGDGSVTRWIGDLKASGDSAARHLWERYFHASSTPPAPASARRIAPARSRTKRT